MQEFVSSNTPRSDDVDSASTRQPSSLHASPVVSRFGSATDIFGEKLSLNLTDANRKIIKKLAAHAAYDAARGTAITATNVVAFLLMTKFRGGASAEAMAAFAKSLHRDVEYKGICFSFSGEMEAVCAYGVTLLGEHLVLRREKPTALEDKVEVGEEEEVEKKRDRVEDARTVSSSATLAVSTLPPPPLVIYHPNLALPFAMELLYYANPLVHVFSLESAVALAAIDAFQTDVVALKTLRKDSLNVERETILRNALFLADLLQVSFVSLHSFFSYQFLFYSFVFLHSFVYLQRKFIFHSLLSFILLFQFIFPLFVRNGVL